MERVDAMTFAKYLQVGDVVMYANALWTVAEVTSSGNAKLVHVEYGTELSIAGEVKVFKV